MDKYKIEKVSKFLSVLLLYDFSLNLWVVTLGTLWTWHAESYSFVVMVMVRVI